MSRLLPVMSQNDYLEELIAQIAQHFAKSDNKGDYVEPVDGLVLIRHSHPSHVESFLYEPVACLILQGRKETTVGDRTVSFGPGESLIVSHELPVTSQVTEASPDCPYIALALTLDLGLLRGLYGQMSSLVLDSEEARSIDVHRTDVALQNALSRYLNVLSEPRESAVLGPLALQEIHYRLLLAPHGAMLRQLLWHDSHANSIARAISSIRRDYKSPLVMSELARSVGMSTSAFHTHFKSVTETTPLQYQKDLRLLEAKRLLLEERTTVSAVAFEVGYGSAAQFSREYSRKFGVPPSEEAR
ncbi:MAG: AraC family transcriptional regulator [Pseudomonadota bacterium]